MPHTLAALVDEARRHMQDLRSSPLDQELTDHSSSSPLRMLTFAIFAVLRHRHLSLDPSSSSSPDFLLFCHVPDILQEGGSQRPDYLLATPLRRQRASLTFPICLLGSVRRNYHAIRPSAQLVYVGFLELLWRSLSCSRQLLARIPRGLDQLPSYILVYQFQHRRLPMAHGRWNLMLPIWLGLGAWS
jgi:hypothetical protein